MKNSLVIDAFLWPPTRHCDFMGSGLVWSDTISVAFNPPIAEKSKRNCLNQQFGTFGVFALKKRKFELKRIISQPISRRDGVCDTSLSVARVLHHYRNIRKFKALKRVETTMQHSLCSISS